MNMDKLTSEEMQVQRNHGKCRHIFNLLILYSNANQFIDDLTRRANRDGISVFKRDELYRIYKNEMNMNGANFDKFIAQLNHNGYLLQVGANGNTYKLVTSVEATTPARRTRHNDDIMYDY
jgi:hypothetical protein